MRPTSRYPLRAALLSALLGLGACGGGGSDEAPRTTPDAPAGPGPSPGADSPADAGLADVDDLGPLGDRLYRDNPVPFLLQGPVIGPGETGTAAESRRELDVAFLDGPNGRVAVEAAWALDDGDDTQLVAALTNLSGTTICQVRANPLDVTLVDGSTLDDRAVRDRYAGLPGQTGRSFGDRETSCIAPHGSILGLWTIEDVGFEELAAAEFGGLQASFSPAGEVVLETPAVVPLGYSVDAGSDPTVTMVNRRSTSDRLDELFAFVLDADGLPLHGREIEAAAGGRLDPSTSGYAPGEEHEVRLAMPGFRGASTRLLVVPIAR